MSSQLNQSFIDGIRCLQYLAGQEEAIGCRELARLMDMDRSRVNRLLMSMASIGLAVQDEKRRYKPGPGIHALAAQALRGSTQYRHALSILNKRGSQPYITAFGVMWEQSVVYLYHSKPFQEAFDALADYQIQKISDSALGIHHLSFEQSSDELIALDNDVIKVDQLGSEKQCFYCLRETGEQTLSVKVETMANTYIAFAGLYEQDGPSLETRANELIELAKSLNV